MSRKIVRRALAGALFFVPLIAGTVYATTQNVDPAATWSATQETQQGAPAVQEDPSLVDIRRAAGEAGSQASLLKNGTTQLVDGTTALNNGAAQLGDGTKAAQNGAAQLADGMVKLQAATGQMGNGATEIANGIDQAVGQFQNVEVIRGQLLTAINLAMSDPKLADVKPDLEDFKRQVETFKVDDNITSQMNKLRDGSRELANQLAVPGYGFHDGIYSATKGSKDLSAGLNDLSGGVDQALTGIRDLDNGAKKIDAMAKENQTRVGNIQRALPITKAGTPEAQEQGVTRTLAPLYAFLIAAGLMLAATAYFRDRIWGTIAFITLTLLGGGLVYLLGTEITAGVAAAAAGVSALAVAGAALLGTLLTSIFGERTGRGLSALVTIAQVAVVGFVWNSAANSALSSAAKALVNFMPLHYPTLALSSIGNAGDTTTTALGVGVTAACAVCAAAGVMILRKKEEQTLPTAE